jgi:hypothetical protein
MWEEPVFVPFAKAVSAPELIPSYPGSARAHPAWQALPACGALTEAEPLDPCVPRRSLGTRRPQEQKR